VLNFRLQLAQSVLSAPAENYLRFLSFLTFPILMHTTISMAFLDTEPREHRLDQQTHQQDDNGVEIYCGCQGWPDMNLLSELGGTFNYIQHRWHCIYRASHWLAISVVSLLTMCLFVDGCAVPEPSHPAV
jgi:hypothetical protein